MNPRLACLFHELENIHLTKDIGMIPYILYKEFNYDSTIICYNIDQYHYLENELKGLKIDFIKKRTGNSNIDTYLYLIKNAHKYDIFQIYHATIYNLLFLLLFKLLNFYKANKTYLKLDTNESIFYPNGYGSVKLKIFYFLMNFADIISTETTLLYNRLVKMKPYEKKIIYQPNGYYPKINYNFETKQNIMICVGRVGDKWKQNKHLMEAFVRFYKINKNWKLKFLGAIANDFHPVIDKYFIEYPELKNVVEFTGNISDKEQLLGYYQEAKILISTSKAESFGMVFTEAMNSGCYIITSNVISANDVTDYGKTGEIFPIGNIDALVNAMKKTEEKLKSINPNQIEDYNNLRDKFYWKDILQSLNDKLQIK